MREEEQRECEQRGQGDSKGGQRCRESLRGITITMRLCEWSVKRELTFRSCWREKIKGARMVMGRPFSRATEYKCSRSSNLSKDLSHSGYPKPNFKQQPNLFAIPFWESSKYILERTICVWKRSKIMSEAKRRYESVVRKTKLITGTKVSLNRLLM